MNLITKADVDKFLKLLQVGLKHGKEKELKNYTSAMTYDNISVIKEHYVHIELSFRIDDQIMKEMFIDEDFDIGNQIEDLLKEK